MTGVLLQLPPFCCRREAACGAVKQFDAVMIFQLANGLTDCAGGHAQMRCGGIHAAVLQHGGKNIDKFKFYAAGRFRRGGLCRLHRGRVGLDGGSKSCFWAGVRCAAGI